MTNYADLHQLQSLAPAQLLVTAQATTKIRPAFWSDNDVTLWPGESETLHVSYARADLCGGAPVVSVSGWNIAPADVPAG